MNSLEAIYTLINFNPLVLQKVRVKVSSTMLKNEHYMDGDGLLYK